MSPAKKQSRGKEKVIESPPPTKKSKKSLPEFDSSRFLSAKAYALHEKLSKKQIHTGCFVRFSDLEEFNVRTLFEVQGWVNLLTLQCNTYPTIVRLFYSNLQSHYEKPDVLKSKVLDTTFLIDPEFLGNVLKIPNDGVDIFDEMLSSFEFPDSLTKEEASMILHGDDFPHLFDDQLANTLLPRPRVLANLLGHTIIPKTGSRNVLSGCHKLLTVCLIRGIRVNLPLFLIKAFWHISGGSMNLYYGRIITKIVEGAHISLKGVSEIQKPDKDYGSLYLNLMKSSGSLTSSTKSAPKDQALPTDEDSSTPTAPLPTILDLMNCMSQFEKRMMARLEETKLECMDMFDSTNRMIERHFTYIYSKANIPPPPPPPKEGESFEI